MALPLLPSSPVHKPFNAVPEMYNVEVYKQSNGFTTESKVRKDLGLMDWRDALNGLDLHHQVLSEKVHPISELESYSLSYNRKIDLGSREESSSLQFVLQTRGVSAFQ